MSTPPARALGDGAAFQAIFFEEADEHLAAVEQALLRLDPAAPADEDLNAIFRVLGVRTRVEAILRARQLGMI